jgi:hypothetical protein
LRCSFGRAIVGKSRDLPTRKSPLCSKKATGAALQPIRSGASRLIADTPRTWKRLSASPRCARSYSLDTKFSQLTRMAFGNAARPHP